jgi:hypothetical protein
MIADKTELRDAIETAADALAQALELLPAPMPTGSEMINVRLSSGLVDQLEAAAADEGTTRKVIITRALARAGFHVPAHDLEDRRPKKRRRGMAA